jgi:hypothetical protein
MREAVTKAIKTIAKFDESLIDEIESMGRDDLEARVLESERNLFENERSEKADVKLEKAKTAYDALKRPYAEAKKLQTAIIQYAMHLLDGGDARSGADD